MGLSLVSETIVFYVPVTKWRPCDIIVAIGVFDHYASYVYIYMYVCVCMCVCVYIYIYIYIYKSVGCVGYETVEAVSFCTVTGYVMHHQFNIQQLYALPTLYLCVLYLSENKQRLVPLTA